MDNKSKVKELKERISNLISHYTKRKDDAVAINQRLYKKKESIKEMEFMEKLPPQFSEAFFTAYFIHKQAIYSNYQEELLKLNNFDKTSYLDRMEKEVEMSERGAGFIVDSQKDYPLFILSEDEARTLSYWKKKLLELAQEQANKMWEENRPDELFGLDKETYINSMVKGIYDKLVKKYFYETNNKNENDRK